MSPNYPGNYGINKMCTITTPSSGRIYAESFQVEDYFDWLRFDTVSRRRAGRQVSGSSGGSNSKFNRELTSSETLTFSSDYSEVQQGFKICVSASSLLQVKSSASGAQCAIPEQDIIADEKPCGDNTVLEDGEKCTPSCSEGMAAKDAEFECKDGELHEVGGGLADPEDLKCKPVSAPTGSLLKTKGAQCTIPEQEINADEKPCGDKTVLEDGEKCTPSCSEGMAAKDAEFECRDGELHEVGGGVADPEDLKCKPTSSA